MKNTFIKLTLPLTVFVWGWFAALNALAANDAWVGNTDANWSTAANWAFSSGSAVNSGGDFLIFGAAGASGATLNNDLSSYSFAGIAFTNGASAFDFEGNSFTLAGGITNSATTAQLIDNNITLTGNQAVSATTGNITLGGIIDDAGLGYGLTFPGIGHTVTLANADTYSGGTTNLSGTLAFSGSGSVSNSSIVLGKTGSGIGAFLTVGSATQPAGTTVFASNLTVNASTIGGNNFNNLNTVGSPNGSVVNQFSGALILNSGLLRASLAPNAAGNMEFLFNNFSRSPGTVFSMDRTTIAPGTFPIASSPATANIVFTVPPTLLGTGAAGSTSNGIVQGVTIAYGPATYDSTYGLRALFGPTAATPEQANLTTLTNVATSPVPGQNALATAGATISANLEINSLQMNNSFTVGLAGHTLTVDSGYVSSSVNGIIGSAANDGFLALGAEGFFDVANARTMTVNSVITGANGLTINLDDLNGTTANCVLSGTNTFTGVTRILANQTMTLKLNNSLALQNSTLDYNNYGGTITFNGPTSFTFGGLKGAQNLAITVPLTLGGDGDSTTYSGVLSGAGSLTKIGSGAFTLANANTYSGGTTISNGQVNINNGGTSSATSAIGTGALTITGGTIDNTSGSTVTLLPNNAQNWKGDFTFAGSSSLNLGTGLVALNGNRQITVSANTLTVGGAISGVGFSLTKNGNGTLALSGANTYSGNTTVNGGKLTLSGSGSIGSSPSISVSKGATLDVSGLSSFTLGGSQSLYGSGTNSGSVTAASGSQIYADSGVAYGTNTFNNNLTLVSGAAANFQLGTVANGANDLIAVGGNLTLAGNALKISAPSSSVNLDASDYTLFTANGTISGSFAVTPTWVVQPLNFNHYTIVTSGNTVKLHYSTTVSPVGMGSVSPNPVSRNQSTVITVTVTTPGSSGVSAVTVNTAPIGGAVVSLVEVGATTSYTNTVTVGAGVAAGSTPLTATITDTDTGSASIIVPLTVLAGTVTWNGLSGSDNNWSDTANWVGGISPLGGDDAIFAGTARLTPVMDNSFSLNSLTFDATAGSFSVTNSSGSLLTLNGLGITNNSANAQALNVPIALSTAQTVNTAAGDVTLGGVVSGTSLTKVGANALTLSGTNTYGSGTTVNAGTIVVANNSALGSGALTFGGGSISNAAGNSYSVPNNLTVSSPGNVGVGSGDALTLSGTISGVATLTKIGNGSLVLSSANDISGGVTVGAGTLVVGNNSALGSGLLTLGNGSISNSAGSSYSVGNTVSLSGAANVIVGTNDTFTFSGLITNTGSLGLVGNGTLSIPGVNANTYSGGTVLNAGTLLVVGNTSVSPLGLGTLTFAGGALADTGVAPVTISNNITVLTNTTTTLNPATFNGVGMTLAGNISGPGNIVVLGNAGNFDSFILSGNNSGFTGTLTVNNGGDQRFGFGSPDAGSPNAAFVLNSAGTDEQKVTFGGTNTISFGSLSGAGWIRNDGGAGLTTFRIGDLNTDSTFSGIIFQNGTAQIGVLKIGMGTLTLSGANTYTGPTTISNGSLLINGSISGSAVVTVTTNGTLGGSGTISGVTTVNAGGRTLPGGSLTNITGTTTSFGGNLTYNAGAEADFNLSSSSGSGNDQINVSGTLTGNGIVVGINLTDLVNTNLDTTADYALFNGSIAGGFASQPKWLGLTPPNSANYSIVNTGGQILLHYSPILALATATPNPATRNQLVTISVNATPLPGNTISTVTVDVSALGESSALSLVQSNGTSIYTNSVIVSPATAPGPQTLTVTLVDSASDTVTIPLILNITGVTEVWNGDAVPDNIWGDALNWENGSVPLTGDLVTFAGTHQLTPDMESSYSIGSLTFDGTAGQFNITNDGSSTLTLTGSVTNNSTNTEILSVPIAVSGRPTFNTAAGNIVISNNLSDDGNGFIKTGTNTLALTSINSSYNGPTTINNGVLALLNEVASGFGPVTNNAILQLADANAVGASALTLDSGSTLQLRSDIANTFSAGSLTLQNASDILTFDVGPLTPGVTGNTLMLAGTLTFGNSSDQTINVTGNSTYTLSLGDITLTSASHTPYLNLNVNTLPVGSSVVINSVTAGNFGTDVNMNAGGKVTVVGNLSNISNGEVNLFVNNGTTVTLEGQSVKAGTGDGYKYDVVNGTLVLDNSGALINNTTGAGLNQSVFILGAATNVFSGNGYTHSAGALTATNNSFNAAVYLGDANNASGGLTTSANLTNNVSDGDAGFVNSGVMTIGGQNTGGINTYANPIILGWTANRGKSVTLVAATGGEVDFANILANGTDQTAGVTAGDATHHGLVKFTGVNTYRGNTTVNGGTLEVANANFSTNSTVAIANGATLQLDFAGVNTVAALVLNGVSKPAGTYNSGNTALITGSGSIRVVPVATPPVAGFSGTPTNGFAPLSVTFTDVSTGSITNWVWSFGDGSSVTNTSNISQGHTYSIAGTNTVSLIVNGPGGSSTNARAGYIAAVSAKAVFGGSANPSSFAHGTFGFSGTGGPAGVQYRALTQTNVAQPLANWTPIYTNVFGPNGNYGYTNSTLTGNQGYLILVSP